MKSAHPSLKPLLKKIGLNEKQITLYLTLLSLKRARASEIASEAKESRSHSYVLLRELEEMGLVSEVKEEKILTFVAEPAEKLLSYIKDRERYFLELHKLAEGALPLLSSITSSYIQAPQVTVLKGIDGMKQTYRDILSQKFDGIYNAQRSFDILGGNIVTLLFGNDVELRGRDLLVNNEGADRYLSETPFNKDYQARILPDAIQFDTDTIIYGNTVVLFAFDEEKTIIRIENKKIADTLRSWFEVLWNMSNNPQSSN